MELFQHMVSTKVKGRRRKPAAKMRVHRKHQAATTKKSGKQRRRLLDEVQQSILSLPILPA